MLALTAPLRQRSVSQQCIARGVTLFYGWVSRYRGVRTHAGRNYRPDSAALLFRGAEARCPGHTRRARTAVAPPRGLLHAVAAPRHVAYHKGGSAAFGPPTRAYLLSFGVGDTPLLQADYVHRCIPKAGCVRHSESATDGEQGIPMRRRTSAVSRGVA